VDGAQVEIHIAKSGAFSKRFMVRQLYVVVILFGGAGHLSRLLQDRQSLFVPLAPLGRGGTTQGVSFESVVGSQIGRSWLKLPLSGKDAQDPPGRFAFVDDAIQVAAGILLKQRGSQAFVQSEARRRGFDVGLR